MQYRVSVTAAFVLFSMVAEAVRTLQMAEVVREQVETRSEVESSS